MSPSLAGPYFGVTGVPVMVLKVAVRSFRLVSVSVLRLQQVSQFSVVRAFRMPRAMSPA